MSRNGYLLPSPSLCPMPVFQVPMVPTCHHDRSKPNHRSQVKSNQLGRQARLVLHIPDTLCPHAHHSAISNLYSHTRHSVLSGRPDVQSFSFVFASHSPDGRCMHQSLKAWEGFLEIIECSPVNLHRGPDFDVLDIGKEHLEIFSQQHVDRDMETERTAILLNKARHSSGNPWTQFDNNNPETPSISNVDS